MKKAFKWLAIVVFTPILLFLILTLLLYLPPVQNWVAGIVADYASEKTGTEVSVGYVRLKFPLDLEIDDFRMLQLRTDTLMGPIVPPTKDTIADVKRLTVDIQLLPLFCSQVEIDALELNEAKVNTAMFIHEARIRGKIGRLYVESHGIALDSSFVKLNTAQLEDSWLDIALSDTVPPDTTPSKNFWKIDIDDLSISKTNFTLHMPGDTMSVRAQMTKALAKSTYLDLHQGLYKVHRLDWNGGALNYDQNFVKPQQSGFDASHIALSDVDIGIDDLYYCAPKLAVNIRSARFKEKSGLEVTEFSGPFTLDDKQIMLPDMKLRTPNSQLLAKFQMDMNAFDNRNPGKFLARLDGSVGKQDMMAFLGDMPTDFIRHWPNRPLSLKGRVEGNMKFLDVKGLTAKLPGAFDLYANGWIANPTDMDNLRANMTLKGRADNLDFVTALLPADVNKQVHIPHGIGIDGQFKAENQQYVAEFRASEGGGIVQAKALFNARTMAYQLQAKANNLHLEHFVPNQGLHAFTGEIDVRGQGTDFLSPRSALTAKAKITRFQFDRWNLDNINGDVVLQNGRINGTIDSRNALMNGRVSLNGKLQSNDIDLHLAGQINHADLYNLRFVDQPLTVSGAVDVDFASDLRDYYKVKGYVGQLNVSEKSEQYAVEDMYVDILTRRDTTHAVVDCHDFHLDLNARGGYRYLLAQATDLSKTIDKQLKDKWIDQPELFSKLPDATLRLTSGPENILSKLLKRQGIQFQNADIDLTSSHLQGVNGTAHISSFVYEDSTQIDQIDLALKSDGSSMTYDLDVVNNKDNPFYVFRAQLSGALHEKGVSANATIYDEQDRLGLDLGLVGTMEDNGIRLNIASPVSTIGYKEFKVNDGNYIFIGNDKRLSADMKLQAADGAGVQIYTDDSDSTALQDITFSMHRFELEKVFSVLPFTPSVSGVLDGDFHLVQTADALSVSSDMLVQNLIYEHCPMGDVGAQLVYMPHDDGSHYVDGILTHNGDEVGILTGFYRSEGKGYLDAKFGLNEFPLEMVNGFVPDQIVGLRGTGEGTLDIKGPLNQLDVNGEVYLKDSYLVSVPYGIEMRFADDPVRVVNSHLLFENFEMFANNDSPLNIQGELDFSNMDRMMLNVRMRAQNFLLIDAKENSRSEAYGKAYVNFFGSMQGPLDALRMRGKLDVLGATDMTYVLRESTLTTDNHLDELVRFVDFNDTTTQVVNRPPLSGMNMVMTISIDEAARIVCALNADKSNYIDLIGGGELRMTYNSTDDLRLHGRYTLNRGEMKYSLQAIPLRTFNIQDGSYVEFTGDPANPTLHITATETVKANVADGTSTGKMVDFVCGVKLTKTLENPGVEFIIDAPEDMTVQNELNTKSTEERGKLAVSMLASGLYLDGNTSGLSVNGALASFMQTEINAITGNALRSLGLDITAGMENATDASGNIHTDYSFKFSKRLWNNRLRVVVGGRVSTGSGAEETGAFFDNLSLEYRLNQKETQYLKLFYERDAYDWLEGQLSEYGIGFMWRRKLDHFKDIFRFKSKEQVPVVRPQTQTSSQTPLPEAKDTTRGGSEVKDSVITNPPAK